MVILSVFCILYHLEDNYIISIPKLSMYLIIMQIKMALHFKTGI